MVIVVRLVITSSLFMRFLSNNPNAKRNRHYRARKKQKGLCVRCPKPATEGFSTCKQCRDEGRERMRIWLTR